MDMEILSSNMIHSEQEAMPMREFSRSMYGQIYLISVTVKPVQAVMTASVAPDFATNPTASSIKQYTREEYEELVPRIIKKMISLGEW